METEYDYKKALSETHLKTWWIAKQMDRSKQTITSWRRGDTSPSKGDILLLKVVLQNGVIKHLGDD